MESKTNWKFVFIYALIATLIFVLFYPTLLNMVLAPALFPKSTIEGTAFMNWIWALQGEFFNITAACCFLWIAGAVICWTSMFTSKKGVGDEHGSARFLTDKEFDALVPNYNLHKNEYEHIREDSEDTTMKYLKTSDTNIFEDIDFVSDKEVYDNEECQNN